MNAQVYLRFGENNLNNFTLITKQMEKAEKQLKLDNSGKLSSIPKLKQELHICFTKMLVIENQINKI